jgi:riboflavin kinase/FMN adenylyltransferase
MLVLSNTRAVPPEAKGAALALGNFDGVHRGHQALIGRAIDEARATGQPAGVLVFEPHPRVFFSPDALHFCLTPLKQKLKIFEALGLDLAVVLPFDAALAALDAETFVAGILVRDLAVSHVVAGYHFFFGKNRSGSSETLKAQGEKHGFGVSILAPVADRGEPYSSTAIRLLLAEGEVQAAAEALGRPWSVSGPVIGGAKRGTGLGFPTANVALPKGTALGHGIFAVRAKLEGPKLDGPKHESTTLDGAAYLGTRPTFDDGMPVLEVFLFDFDETIYGREIEVVFIDKVRDDRKFASSKELIAQMHADCAKARDILAAVPRS